MYWDVETAPNLGIFFKAGYDQMIRPESIIQERKTICVCWKWEGERKVYSLIWDKNQDDKQLLKDFVKVSEEADEMVAHSGDRYDLPWLRTRCLFHKLEPIPEHKTIDTCAWAKKKFYFNSNKLDYISGFLGHGHKLETNSDLWRDILMRNDQKALAYMVRYCKVDVEKLEKVYHDLARFVKPKTHVGVLGGRERWTCPRTGSRNVSKSKTRVSASGTITHQMRNNADGTYFTINDSAYKSYLNR